MKILTKVILTLFLLFGGCQAYFWWQLHPVKRTSAYVRIKEKRWAGRPELVSHFPPQIPFTAQNSKFHFQPGFLQGGSSMELRMGLPADDILALHRRYSPIAKLSIPGDAELDRSAGNLDMFPKSGFYTFLDEDISSTNFLAVLPEDFQMLLLSSRPYRTEPVNWNHGDATGICISTTRNEVIYWVEAW